MKFRVQDSPTRLLFVALLCAGCAATKPADDVAVTGLKLRYQLPADKTVQYSYRSNSIQKMEVMGQSMQVDIGSLAEFTMQAVEVKEDYCEAKIAIDSMRLNLKSMRGEMTPDMKNVIGKSFSMRISSLGKESDLRGTESIEYELVPGQRQNATSVFQMLFPDFSAEPVKIGGTWTSADTLRTATAMGNVEMIFQSLNTLVALETVENRACAKIVSSFKGPMHGEEDQGPMHFVTNGTMAGTDTIYFAYKEGIVLSVLTIASLDATTEGTGPQTLTIPLKREMRNELRLISTKPAK